MKNLKDKKGFTIIELIVVVAILGILVLLAGPKLLGYVEKAELARIKHDVKVMENKMAEVLTTDDLTTDDEFNKWENNNKDLNQLIQEGKLFEKEGVAKKIESTDEPYKVIPEKYKDNINTKLKGTFYANSGGKVYYEHDKPLSEIPDEPEKNPGYSDEEIEELIEKLGYIPIATAEELNNVRNAITATYGKGTQWEGEYEGGLEKNYIQVANVDLSGYSEGEGWAPIGSPIGSESFTGSFDGNGYSITGLKINRPETEHIGLFGYTDKATIRNVALEDINVTGGDYTGGLVGYADSSTIIKDSYATGSVSGGSYDIGGLVGYAGSSTIENSYATGEVTGGDYTGGLVGEAKESSISNSYATGKVTGTGNYYTGGLVGWVCESTITNSYATGEVTGEDYTGGLVGKAKESSISNSYATGSVSGEGYYIGGLVGYADSSTIIKDSYATGSVTGEDLYTGGLVGGAYKSTITNSYATGEVTGEYNTGGLVGWASYATTITNSYATGKVTGEGDNTGGLVGVAYNSTEITNSYATGKVTGDYYTGGLVGYADSSTITNSYATGAVTGTDYHTGGLVGGAGGSSTISNSYWDTKTTGQSTSAGGGEGKSTVDMMKEETYTDWDFENTWEINEGQSYPTLRNIAN